MLFKGEKKMEYLSPLILMLIEHTCNGDLQWMPSKDNEDLFIAGEFSFHRYASPEGTPLYIEDTGFDLRNLECEILRCVIDPDYKEKYTKAHLKLYWKKYKEIQSVKFGK